MLAAAQVLLTAALELWPMSSAQAQAGGPALSGSGPAAACGDKLPIKVRRTVQSTRHQIAFVVQPAPAVGRHFGLELVVCPRGDTALPIALRVDADMPAHRHGMNYRPTVRDLGHGRYRVDGLLFHMTGRWRLLFELSADGRLDRLHHEVNLE